MLEGKKKDKFLELCLRGSSLLLPLSEVLKYDWLVSRMLASEVPSHRTASGALYLDWDPKPFRFIWDVLIGSFLLDEKTMSQLYKSEGFASFCKLKATADYLCWSTIYESFDAFEVSKGKEEEKLQMKIRAIEVSKQKEVGELQVKIRDLESQLLKKQAIIDSGIESRMLNSDCAVLNVACGAFRKYRSGNRCGNEAVLFVDGSTNCEGTWLVTCPCGEEHTLLFHRGSNHDTRKAALFTVSKF